MQAQGDAAGALAAQRADELAATDESNRPLREAGLCRPGRRRRAEGAGRCRGRGGAQAEAIANKRRDLEIRLMEATGDAAGALAASAAPTSWPRPTRATEALQERSMPPRMRRRRQWMR
jgi:hypothetical protein